MNAPDDPRHHAWLAAECDRLLTFAQAARHPEGGFAWLADDGTPVLNRPVELWITARMTHVFSLAHMLGRPRAAEFAEHGLEALNRRLRDIRNGGWWASVTTEGPVATEKLAYEHAFVLLAAASAVTARLDGGEHLLDAALQVHDEHFWDERQGAVVEQWDSAFVTLDPYRGANANMHTVEALLAAGAVTRSAELHDRALRIVTRFTHAVAAQHGWRLPEHYTAEWAPLLEYNRDRPGDPFRPYGATVGHAFEWARLSVHLATALGDRAPDWILDDAQRLFAAAVNDGWAVDGAPGFVYTTDWAGTPVVRARMHWVAAEAIGAAAVLHKATAKTTYAELYSTWWEYVQTYLIDQAGSWHHELSPDNRPASGTWSGKPDVYHAIQATLLPRLPLAPSFASAIRDTRREQVGRALRPRNRLTETLEENLMSNRIDADSEGARHFPAGFLFATGTSAYQVEGAVNADGRLPSIWDTFVRTPGAIVRGDTGDVACDSYHRIDDDIQLVRDLGVGAYRFSVSWSRVLPTGGGAINQAGLDYYRRLCAGLREQGITPVATLYHWDLPQALEDRGGWSSREAAERMGEFAQLMGEALRDDVGLWITINEPLQVANLGYRVGAHAPGVRDLARAAAATHHIMLAHGLALQALRAVLPAGVPIGPTMDPQPYIALDPESELTSTLLDAEINRVFLDPVFKGSYPDDLRDEFRPPTELVKPGDMELISAPIDFFGVNYYRPHYVRRGDWSDLRIGESPIDGHPGFVEYKAPELEKTIMDWLVVPEGLSDLLMRLYRYSGGVKIYVTENGCASEDYVNPEGTINDRDRVSYIRGHLSAVLDAIEAGVDVAGYFHWSLMDNFEWAFGYGRRFGLYYVDFETGRRLPKDSAHYYGEIARTGVLPAIMSSADLAAA